ncbi:unnamed protein product [Cylicocyclus nassatus]|uniref:Aminoacyl-transfer RNA synthetases class-II family profile domain-containing protein n=1 Tax=Cylicocyclus nassatus TaxID=53992 RepID=A0AA36DMZ5_CYLNA|nr:unnamed protein product [Cylicocyclus nassatus]
MGWLAYKRMNRFLVLRDAYGTVQATVAPKSDLANIVKDLPYESIVQVEGCVIDRGENKNLKMKTGEIEIDISKLTVLNRASANLPMLPDAETSERTRLTYRYIDLRTERMQRALRMRSDIVHKMRRFLVEKAEFVDVETPTLFRRTPGGAAEFIVPAPPPNRGQCYSLPQSPQQFKQLLMVGGIDRYFQIARCYRDEGSKGDRQPEFTQVDLEMSFTNQEGVLSVVEDTLLSAWPEELEDLKPTAPFPRLNFKDAVRLYGSDKPDMRIPWQIEDCTEKLSFLRKSSSPKNWVARFIICKGHSEHMKRLVKKEFERILAMNKLSRPFAIFDTSRDVWFKTLKAVDMKELFGVEDEDCVAFSWGDEDGVQWTLGQLRNMVAEVGGLRKQRKICAHWIVNFPLFSVEDGKVVSSHHPFTAPINEHRKWLDDPKKILEITGQHYDLVLNGVELGGGSIRIHDPEEQAHVLEILGEDTQEMKHLLEALSYGAPPHGGFALGLDRYIALMASYGDPSHPVREVIAFPKSKEGRDLMSKAPVTPNEEQLKRYGVRIEEDAEAVEASSTS